MKFPIFALLSVLALAAPSAAAGFTVQPDPLRSDENWDPTFSARTVSVPPAKQDPGDSRVAMSGLVVFEADGSTMLLNGTGTNQKHAIMKPDGSDGFLGTHVDVFSKVLSYGSSQYAGEGLNLFGASNHCKNGDDACDAGAYYFYPEFVDGKVCLNKRYTWGAGKADPICKKVFDGSYPLNQLVGMRLVTYPVGDDNVQIIGYLDYDDGKGWQPEVYFLDEPGKWNVTGSIPSECVADFVDGEVFNGNGECVAIHNIGDALQPFEARTLVESINNTEAFPIPDPNHISDPVMTPLFGDDGLSVTFDYTVGESTIETYMMDPTCTNRVDEHFNVTIVDGASREDGYHDFTVTVEFLPSVKNDPNFFDATNPELPRYDGCLHLEVMVDHDFDDSTPMLGYRIAEVTFPVVVDMVSGATTLLDQNEGGDEIEFTKDTSAIDALTDIDMWQCDLSGAPTTAVLSAGAKGYLCIEAQSPNIQITRIKNLAFELLDGNGDPINQAPFVVIEEGVERPRVQTTRPDYEGETVWMVEFELPEAEFFVADGQITASVVVLKNEVAGRRLTESIQEEEGSASEELNAKQMDTGVVRSTYTISVMARDAVAPTETEETRAAAEILQYALRNFLPSGFFAKVARVGDEIAPVLRFSRRLDEDIEIEFVVRNSIECGDASCAGARDLLESYAKTTTIDLQTAVEDGSLTVAVREAAKKYKVDEWEGAEIFSFSKTDPEYQVVSALDLEQPSSSTGAGNDGSTAAKIGVTSVAAAGFVGVVSVAMYKLRGNGREDEGGVRDQSLGAGAVPV
mmetsp:Transcript_24513/g.53450  ORF Transcript_24513/g.53450 Transcript_24513/m.53450 type:complete len:797 (-) Transcript_24513:197-2587(-)|eukprot:CAMPEP_0178528646 /NCGR_PEP_ID=MMETSP0696-20121128/31913_1 /TAXON_ID=265572 /ORGANISM="Extubocellulus spinifer, Strain CCMP396" /LENGTH=796 /DNA_ID=CAMNT_0020160313 /DNA_START=803 /DNA_END=3193 /DNA_ORIENTATION=-